VAASLEEKYHGKDDLIGVTSLTVPTYISSNRAIMFASHLKQLKTLKYKELPRMRTNYEDVVGHNSSYLHTADYSGEVVSKIDKFAMAPGAIYYMFVYDKKEDMYHLEIKKQGVELQERFGFHINNDNMDALKVGDKIKEGDTLWKSNSYDEDDLYGFGLNARCVWLVDNWTIEDAIKVRKGFAESVTFFYFIPDFQGIHIIVIDMEPKSFLQFNSLLFNLEMIHVLFLIIYEHVIDCTGSHGELIDLRYNFATVIRRMKIRRIMTYDIFIVRSHSWELFVFQSLELFQM
jgi:hypothetical protein